MKTPDEIKKGLKCHIVNHSCRGCPYKRDTPIIHINDLYDDALAYIQQLENDLQYTTDAANVMKDEALKLEYRLAQVERERDAAVHDLPIGIDCNTCKYSERAYEEQPCSGCKEYRGPWYPLHWEWRGVCPENTKEDTTDEPT